MWHFALVGLWVVRGGTMDTKPTDLPTVILPAPRTRADVEAELIAARNTQRRGPARRRPDDITLRDVAVNALLDEWATLARGGMHQPIEG